MCHSLIGMKQAAERQGGALLPRQRPDSVRTIRPPGWAAPPTLPWPPAAAGISKAALYIEQLWSFVCQGGGGRRDTEGSWFPPSALLAGVPRGLGPGRMVHTWVAASASPGSVACLGAQVSCFCGVGVEEAEDWPMAWPR